MPPMYPGARHIAPLETYAGSPRPSEFVEHALCDRSGCWSVCFVLAAHGTSVAVGPQPKRCASSLLPAAASSDSAVGSTTTHAPAAVPCRWCRVVQSGHRARRAQPRCGSAWHARRRAAACRARRFCAPQLCRRQLLSLAVTGQSRVLAVPLAAPRAPATHNAQEQGNVLPFARLCGAGSVHRNPGRRNAKLSRAPASRARHTTLLRAHRVHRQTRKSGPCCP